MIGESIARVDAYEKVTGKALYTADYLKQFPEALHMKALRSPYAHARIRRIDTARAEATPGVVGVITAGEPGVRWNSFPPYAILAGDEAIWAGQTVALVAAQSEQAAMDAIAAMEVDYEPLPHVLDWREAIKQQPVSVVNRHLEPRKHYLEEFDSPNVCGEYQLITGDADAAFAQADAVVEGTFWTGKKSHSQLERAACIAQYTPSGGLTLWCNGCGVHGVIKRSICAAFSLPESQVRVIQAFVGGNFGNRNTPYVEMQAALMALKTKGTVFFEFSRKEMFLASPSNWACATKIRLGATADGTLTAKDCRLIEEIGAWAGKADADGRKSSSCIASVYAIPNVRMHTCGLLTNTVPAGNYRGLGAPEAVFGFELLIDELADRLGIDGLTFRKKNLLQPGQYNDYGELVTSTGVGACLDAVAKAIAYDTPCVQDDPVWRKGKGIACACKQNGPKIRSEAEALVFGDGSIQIRFSCDRQGMGAVTSITQIAAEIFGVPADQIRAVMADTDVTPFDTNSASCSSIYRTGNAVKFACEDALRQLQEAAARYAGVHPSMVRVSGSTAYITGSHIREFPITDLFAAPSQFVQNNWGLKQGTPVRGVGVFSPGHAVPWGDDGRTPRMWNWFQYAASAVEIAVNIQTGQIRVLRVANAGDPGNPINPSCIEGQLEGASHMTIGFALQEEHLYDQHGALTNANMSDYRLPTILSMPKCEDVASLICSDPLPDGPFGAKGMSEAIVGAIAPAIAQALYRATGVRMRSYPMTAERVLNAIREKEAEHENSR